MSRLFPSYFRCTNQDNTQIAETGDIIV